MKRLLWILWGAVVAFLLALIISEIGIASETVTIETESGPMILTPDFLAYLIASFNGLPGAGVLGGSVILVQVIIRALNQPFANHFFSKLSGWQKLAIVAGLTFAVTPLGLISTGLPIGAALVHTSTLTAFQVLLNQIYLQAVKAKQAKNGGEAEEPQKPNGVAS